MPSAPSILTRIDREKVYGYLSLLSGSAGRIVISMAYFVAVANALSLEDFGLFATASATGVVLSRLAGFGFVSPLYRTATVRRRLIGIFTLGYVAAFLLSLPVVGSVALGFYWLVFSSGMGISTFFMVMIAEILFWRSAEIVIIVNNGLRRFGIGALLTISGTALRAVVALAFVFYGNNQLDTWALLYMLANAVSFLIFAMFFYPKTGYRWKPKAYIGRMRDAFSVSAAEVLFYLQMELDKILVLAVGGETTAGLYAIIMRLVDLTAMPVRAFNTMLVQFIMKNRGDIAGTKSRILTEFSIAAVSLCGIVAIVMLLNFAPGILGNSIAQASGFLYLVLLVPIFRNLVEYHSELLYAREQTLARAVILGLVGLLKAGLLILLLTNLQEFSERALWLNAVFTGLYFLSAYATYGIAFKLRDASRVRD